MLCNPTNGEPAGKEWKKMNLLDLLRKLGILRYGAKAAVYRSGAERPVEFLMDDVYDGEKDLVHMKRKRQKSAPTIDLGE